MSEKFTPGTWKVFPLNGDGLFQLEVDGKPTTREKPADKSFGDAALMQAAPLLYAACKEALVLIDNNDDRHSGLNYEEKTVREKLLQVLREADGSGLAMGR